MRAFIIMLCLFGLSAFCSIAKASQVELYDRQTGQVLQTYRHHGRLYVAGEPGHEYEIRIHSRAPTRTLAVTTIDGVNVISGETGALNQSGYVLDPYGFARIEGWRKSMSRTAAFYFTKLPDSYAARTGRPDNVGVIGVALFRGRPPCCADKDIYKPKLDSAEPVAAPLERRAEKSAGAPQAQVEAKLGTGHGRNEYSQAQYTEFERATNTPDETIVIYYDSQRNLIAQGIIPTPHRYAEKLPQPFPGFVADP